MRKKITLCLLPISMLLLSGCQNDTDDNSSSIKINQIEKNLTNAKTNIGCQEKEKNKSNQEECTDSTSFILNVLKEDSKTELKNIDLIRNEVETSIEKISKEEEKQENIKNSLISFVNKFSPNKKEDLRKFIAETIGEENSVNSKELRLIKNGLKTLVKQEETQQVSPKEVKEKLNKFIQNIGESNKELTQTKITLNQLMDDIVEEDKNNSRKQFVSAMIQDVVDNNLMVIKETDEHYIVKVQKGESLSLLAKRYYHDTRKYKIIYEANKDKINSNYEIFPGTKLLIPKL